MLRGFWEFLPFFLYKKLARRVCMMTSVQGQYYVQPARDTLIRLEPYKEGE
jgi:hypothetical protein